VRYEKGRRGGYYTCVLPKSDFFVSNDHCGRNSTRLAQDGLPLLGPNDNSYLMGRRPDGIVTKMKVLHLCSIRIEGNPMSWVRVRVRRKTSMRVLHLCSTRINCWILCVTHVKYELRRRGGYCTCVLDPNLIFSYLAAIVDAVPHASRKTDYLFRVRTLIPNSWEETY